MLDPRYKSMHLLIIYLGHEVATILVANYDEQILLPLLLEAYKGLLPNRGDCLDEFASLVDSYDLFQHINIIVDTYKDIVCRELGSFRWYPIDA